VPETLKAPRRHFEAENYIGLLDAEVVMSPGAGRLAGQPFDFMATDEDADAAARRFCEHFAASWALNYAEGRNLIVLDQPVIVYKEDEKSPWVYRLRGRWSHPEDVATEFPRLHFMDVLKDSCQQAYQKIGFHP
jgi:hypothetical protein